MSLIIGKPRAVSHSCLVASSIDLPEELEEEVENLDDVFTKQIILVRDCQDYIETNVHHRIFAPWPYIEELAAAFKARTAVVWKYDYVRAMSYGAMRMVSARMTDIINSILPVRLFMEGAIKEAEERVKVLEEAVKQIEQEIETAKSILNEAKKMTKKPKEEMAESRRLFKIAKWKLKSTPDSTEEEVEEKKEKERKVEEARKIFEDTKKDFEKANEAVKEAEMSLKECQKRLTPAKEEAMEARLYVYGKEETPEEKEHREYGEELQRLMDAAQLAAGLRYDEEKQRTNLMADWKNRVSFRYDFMDNN